MMSGPDLADIIALAEACDGKVILAGDTAQLQAIQNGGGMALLASRLGYTRLTEPVPFRQPWEQAASLRLRDGDTTVLAECDQHARIAGGVRASWGDLILCTRNDHTVEAGEPGRTLANGDLLRIDAVLPQGLLVRRALQWDGCRRPLPAAESGRRLSTM
jgi:hypothetical protein